MILEAETFDPWSLVILIPAAAVLAFLILGAWRDRDRRQRDRTKLEELRREGRAWRETEPRTHHRDPDLRAQAGAGGNGDGDGGGEPPSR